MSIKNLRPRRDSQYKQGYYDVANSEKYIGNPPCIYRSGLELKAFNMLENSDRVVKWCSEPCGGPIDIDIKYMINGKSKRYYIDVWFMPKSGVPTIVEIKPYDQVQKPKDPSNKWAMETYVTNMKKWEAAHAYAVKNNINFMIMTDRFFKLGRKIL